jgi:membrane associated rhomboid family serine protease
MLTPLPVSDAPRYPVTSVIGALAIAATALRYLRPDLIGSIDMNYLAFHGQPWRLVTSALPHVNPIHLLFDLYWFWTFSTLIEYAFGPARTLGIYLLLAAGSAAAEHAIMVGGIGLSGIVYGQFALIWVLSRFDRRFEDTIDPPTINLFVIWFFICIGMTYAGMMPIANVAHGAGALLGAVLGWTIAFRGGRRVALASALILVCAAVTLGATVARPKVNLSPHGGSDVAHLAYEALVRNDDARAIRLYQRAVSMRHPEANWWYNLGVAYERTQRRAEARQAFERAVDIDPDTPEYQSALKSAKGE